MSTGEPTVNINDLHAHVDGALTAERATVVEDWLRDNPQERARADDFRRINEALHAFYGPVAHEAVPARMLDTVARRGARRLFLQRAAAALALLLVGAIAGWFGRDLAQHGDRIVQALASESFSAHKVFVVEVRHPVEVAAEKEQHLVRWLTKRLGADVRAPDLRPQGYKLVGGRLLSADTGPAAQMMYETAEGARLTLYVRQNVRGQETAFRFKAADGLSGFYWMESDLAYAIVAELPRERLLAIATVVYEQLER